ncbi:hypothetical protein RHECNPAF_3500062 [Rhizobium etli CNPAF512]|nr:hypothetical protein RHECNPAF_3500062 [Rhizobium etli CNPAF512]
MAEHASRGANSVSGNHRLEHQFVRACAVIERHSALFSQQHGVIGLYRMGVDCLLDRAGRYLDEFRRQAHHLALGRQRELGVEFGIFERHLEHAAARNGGIGDEEEIKQQLDPVLGNDGARSVPDHLGFLLRQRKILGGPLGLASVDRGTDRTGGAKGEAREFQPNGSIERTGADQVHRIGIGAAFIQQFQTVVDRTDGRDDVVANAAAEERGQIRAGQGKVRVLGHHRLLKGGNLIAPGNMRHLNCAKFAIVFGAIMTPYLVNRLLRSSAQNAAIDASGCPLPTNDERMTPCALDSRTDSSASAGCSRPSSSPR